MNKYYSGGGNGEKAEDAYGKPFFLNMIKTNKYHFKNEDMRKSMIKDKDKITTKPTGKKIEPNDLEFH